MELECGKCKNECLESDTTVVCEGFCVGFHRFHARCVGLTDDEGATCLHRNVLWMCNDCCALIEDFRFRDTVNVVRSKDCPVKNEVAILKAEVQKMSETLDCLVERAGFVSSIVCTATTSKCPKTDVPQHSSIEDSPPLTSTRTVFSPPVCTDDSTVKLHLSNIANDVTQDEVVRMIADSIGVQEIISIKCLKPVWKDVSTMDSISFKVEIADCHRSSALYSWRWPKGIRCREFVEFSNTTWRPAR